MSITVLALIFENLIVFAIGLLLGHTLGYMTGYKIGTTKIVSQIKNIYAIHATRKNSSVDVEEPRP